MRYSWFLAMITIMIPNAQATEPENVVRSFHDALVEATRIDDKPSRYEHLSPIIDRLFAVDTVSRIALGRHWQDLDEPERAAVARAIRELVISTYAERFNADTDPEFSVMGATSLSGSRVSVRVRLKTPNDRVQLDYQMSSRGDHWRIYDVIANGVSDLSLKRSVYTQAYAEGGLDAVLEEIRKGIEGAG